MRLFLLPILAMSLSLIVGCGASQASSRAATPADSRDDASWMPAEEVALSIAAHDDAPETRKASARLSTYRPNRQERPTQGAIHAATY